MSLFWAMAVGVLGTQFGHMGALRKKKVSGGNPIPGTPTYYIYGF